MVSLEIGGKRVFASALDWPGWCRSGKSIELALETLAGYAPRYAPVAARATLVFPAGLPDRLEVVEQVAGDATTDFGAPGAITPSEQAPVAASEAARLVALVRAAWTEFDQVAASAPEELRKGPRGGGRDRTKMIGHVLGAEAGYARYLGLKPRVPEPGEAAAVAELRHAVADVLGRPWDGKPYSERKSWPPRYAARRIAWHALDHAWEMEDRSVP
jgi:hypothetical protein